MARVVHDITGNLEPDLDLYPDRPPPVARNAAGKRELARLTWGMPPPPQFLKAPDTPATGATTIRHLSSPHCRRWLGVEPPCTAPATAFS